jgi:hypothetical protein
MIVDDPDTFARVVDTILKGLVPKSGSDTAGWKQLAQNLRREWVTSNEAFKQNGGDVRPLLDKIKTWAENITQSVLFLHEENMAGALTMPKPCDNNIRYM